MEMKFWGVRGSINNPLSPELYRQKIKAILSKAKNAGLTDENSINGFIEELPLSLRTTIGGNTSCVTVYESGVLLILDAGTGIRNLSNDVMRGLYPKPDGNLYNIIFSHLHLDHINGLPFFAPVHLESSKINFFSAHPDFDKFLNLQQNFNFFPVSLDSRPAQKRFIEFHEGDELDFGKLKVTSKKLNHPNDSYALRITGTSGKSIIYATDGEYTAKTVLNDYFDFLNGAEILIFDTQYNFNELAQRFSFGHSTPEIGIDAAVNSNIKKLFLFHHNHDNNDEMIEILYNSSLNYKQTKYPSSELEIIIANEGMTLTI